MLRSLRSPDGDDRIQNSSTDTVDEPCLIPRQLDLRISSSKHTADHPVMIHRGALQARADDRPNRACSYRLDSPHTIAQPTSKKPTDQRTEVVDRDNAALEQGIRHNGCQVAALFLGIPKLHHVDVVGGIIDTGHHTLVITEE